MKQTRILFVLLGILFLTGCGKIRTEGSVAPEDPNTPICSITVTCDSALDYEDLDIELPESGMIATCEDVPFEKGDTALSVLMDCLRKAEMSFEADSGYVTGIENLYAGDCGEESGWMYRVNNTAPSVGADQYVLSDGDAVEWYYICSYDEMM